MEKFAANLQFVGTLDNKGIPLLKESLKEKLTNVHFKQLFTCFYLTCTHPLQFMFFMWKDTRPKKKKLHKLFIAKQMNIKDDAMVTCTLKGMQNKEIFGMYKKNPWQVSRDISCSL